MSEDGRSARMMEIDFDQVQCYVIMFSCSSCSIVTFEGDAVGAVGMRVGAEDGALVGLEGVTVGSGVGWWKLK